MVSRKVLLTSSHPNYYVVNIKRVGGICEKSDRLYNKLPFSGQSMNKIFEFYCN